MRRCLCIGMIALAMAGLSTAGERKLDDEQAELIEAARHEALSYSASLPDFLCTEYIKRREDPRGDNRWRSIDTLTVRLSYFGHMEDYKLMAVNGKPTV